MKEWIDGWEDGWINGARWIHEWMNEWVMSWIEFTLLRRVIVNYSSHLEPCPLTLPVNFKGYSTLSEFVTWVHEKKA